MSRLEAPARPRYVPGRCYALASPSDTTTHCGGEARLFPVGWRCDVHRPGAVRSTTTTTAKEAAE